MSLPVALPGGRRWTDLPLAGNTPMVGLLLAAVCVGAAAAFAPYFLLLALFAGGLIACVATRPALAGYLVVGLTPLIVGIDRGRVIPVLRPNEALLLLCGAGLLVRVALHYRAGSTTWRRPGPIPLALASMAVCNSVIPLMWMAVRNVPITTDDLLYALVLWKYLALYAVVSCSIRRQQEVRRCLVIILGAAGVVAVIAILQSLGLFGVPRLLATFYAPPFGNVTSLSNNRGSSTLALPAATADLMILGLALVVGVWLREPRSRWLVTPLGGLFVIGSLASGQFSGAIGLVVALLALAVLTKNARLPLLFVPLLLGAAWLLQPVINKRLAGFNTVSGVPESWVGRLTNLQNYFLPELSSHFNYLLGVRPGARVPGPRSIGIDWVWIESGYIWLLWGGGVPLFLSFLVFLTVSLRRTWRLARATAEPSGAIATAAFVGLVVWAVLMLLDPHLTYRGAADMVYSLLAICSVSLVPVRPRLAEEPGSRRDAPHSAPPALVSIR